MRQMRHGRKRHAGPAAASATPAAAAAAAAAATTCRRRPWRVGYWCVWEFHIGACLVFAALVVAAEAKTVAPISRAPCC